MWDIQTWVKLNDNNQITKYELYIMGKFIVYKLSRNCTREIKVRTQKTNGDGHLMFGLLSVEA